MKIIEREYLNELISVKGTPDIKVITGVRRSGKSEILKLFEKHIKANENNANIISIDFRLTKFEKLKEYHKLVEYVESKYDESKTNYILIDEVQMCEGFENAINNFHAEEKFDIYITGSNAFLLSSDLATLFTGRTFEIKVMPFSYIEFLKYFNLKPSDETFNKYNQTKIGKSHKQELRKIIDTGYPDVLIEIDGGINLENVRDIVDAGVDVVVAGSAVFKNDVEANTAAFKKIMQD